MSLIGSVLDIVNRAPVPYVGSGQQRSRGDAFGRGGKVEQMQAMEVNATVFSIVNRTSTSVAKEEWHLHRKATAGAVCVDCEAKGVVKVARHPALSVLQRPNNFYTRQELFESGQQHVDLTGEGWLVTYRQGKMPLELWVVRPDRMVVVTDQREFLLGYIYLSPEGREVPLKKQDVMSMRMPHPLDPYRGLGPVQTILSNVRGAAFSAEYNVNFFRNGARPGGIVKLSRTMSDPQFKQLVERFNENHLGVANANRTAFLEEGDWVDVKPYTLADMQFVETADLNRDTILLAFGLSKFAVGVVDDVNRATADASAAWFGETATAPRLDRWRGMLNNDFLPQFPSYNYDLEFVYSNPVPADREADRADKQAAAAIYKVLIDAGVHPEDAAKQAGMPPMRVQEKEPPNEPPDPEPDPTDPAEGAA